jgi:enoyl-CoA hydratase
MSYETLLYHRDGPIATITFNRPEQLNTIVPPMPDEFGDAIVTANRDEAVRVIVVRGAGRAFCAGYDFGESWGRWEEQLNTQGAWDPGKDFVWGTARDSAPTQRWMSMWHSPKPTIAQVHGWCVGGGSDMALCADLVIASDDARIGTPYARMWGVYQSAMWIYRLGLTRAKEYALTGAPLSGKEAADIGLINRAVPFGRLEETVRELALRLATSPPSQLAAQKWVVNQVYESMGMHAAQTLGPVLDGMMRNTPEALRWMRLVEEQGVAAAIAERDGPWGDYSQAPPEDKPDPSHIIEP